MAAFLTCLKINSDLFSYFWKGLSVLFTTKIIGTPQFVIRTSLFKLIWSLLLFSSSERESFIKFPSSSNLGSSYNLILSSTILINKY